VSDGTHLGEKQSLVYRNVVVNLVLRELASQFAQVPAYVWLHCEPQPPADCYGHAPHVYPATVHEMQDVE
jgi:hypothetical protein